MAAVIIVLVIIAIFAFIGLASALKVVQQYEQGVVFRFGQVQLNAVRQAGLTLITPIADRMQKVNMQTVAMGVPAQDGITQDNVSVRVDAVVYFRVIDPVKAIVNVQNYGYAISQVAQTSLRSIIGKSELDDLLTQPGAVAPRAGAPHRRPLGPTRGGPRVRVSTMATTTAGSCSNPHPE